MLGCYYAVERTNYETALKWIKKAANNSHASAIKDFGWMYENGWGVPQDHKEAMRLFHDAASKENLEAKKLLKLIKKEPSDVSSETKTDVQVDPQLFQQEKDKIILGLEQKRQYTESDKRLQDNPKRDQQEIAKVLPKKQETTTQSESGPDFWEILGAVLIGAMEIRTNQLNQETEMLIQQNQAMEQQNNAISQKLLGSEIKSAPQILMVLVLICSTGTANKSVVQMEMERSMT